MENLTNEQWMEKYPYLKEMAKNVIFTSEEDIDIMSNGEKIEVDGIKVSVEFLRRILQDDIYYDYARKFCSGEINSFGARFIIGGDTSGNVGYDRVVLIKGLDQIIKSGLLTIGQIEKERYERLKSLISFESFISKTKGTSFEVSIDGIDYEVPVSEMISFMQLTPVEFDRMCSDNNIKTINNMPKEYFVYAVYAYFTKNNVLKDYTLPTEVIEKYKDIESLQKIDLQAINKHLETKDTKFKSIELDPELELAITSQIPENSTDLEKAIYIYIKMCKLLTYDDEYFAVNQKGPATLKHKDISYVSQINLVNNKIVCFEFNLIYSKLLDKLGIKFQSDYKNLVGEAYGAGHANLEFRSGKYLVSADSVTSILQGDIMQAKLNQPLVGIRCINANNKTKQEFKDALSKMYALIAKQEQEMDVEVEHIQTFDELMSEYVKTTDKVKPVSLNEKLSILINKVNFTQMVGIDSLSYVLQLRKILFNEHERKHNLKVTILRNNEPFDPDRIAMASAIITLNLQSFVDAPEQNIYYYYNPNYGLIPMSLQEVQAKFDNRIFEYIEKDDPKIPGIVESGGIKK